MRKTHSNKKNAVVCVNPHDRQGYILDFHKKYNFIPILIYSEAEDAIGDWEDGVREQIAEVKRRISSVVYLKDNGNDFDKIVKELKSKYNVLAVCPGYDVSLEYVDKLAQALGVNGNDPKTISLRKDKGWVAKQLLKNKIRTPITIDFSLKDQIKTTINKISKSIKTFPVVLKPFEGYGSIGVQIINNKNEFEKILKGYATFQKTHSSMSNEFLAQEYIDGEEGYLDFYSFNGKHLLSDAWMYKKHQVGNNNLGFWNILMTKRTPLLIKAEAYCKKVLDAIGFKWGPTHIEVKYDKKGVCLIEVNMRVMGSHTLLKEPIFFDYSTPELAFLSLSNSPLLAKYLNKNVYDKSKTKCQAFYKINPPYDFVIKKINVEKIAKKLPTFKEFVSFKSVNDKVKKAIDMAGIIGAVDFVGPEKQVRADLEKLHKSWKNNFKDWYKY